MVHIVGADGGQSVDVHRFVARCAGRAVHSCANTAPSSTINSGSMVITFTSETSATVLLPGGRLTTIQPFNFGFGTPPQGLLGQWVYVETIGGVDFADRYNFTTTVGATPNGNGAVVDFDKFASCELQVIGEIAGFVVCGHWSDSTYMVALDIYAYEFGLDQTYNGVWISPTTESAFPMKGYMWISRSGFSNASAAAATPADLSQRALKQRAETAESVVQDQRNALVRAFRRCCRGGREAGSDITRLALATESLATPVRSAAAPANELRPARGAHAPALLRNGSLQSRECGREKSRNDDVGPADTRCRHAKLCRRRSRGDQERRSSNSRLR